MSESASLSPVALHPGIHPNFSFHTTNLPALLGSHLDYLILVLFWDDAAIGLYTVALRWASAGLGTVTSAFSTVLFPHFSAAADPARQRALLANSLRYAMLLLVAGTALCALATPWRCPRSSARVSRTPCQSV